jgi:hypothetical protein
VRLDPLPQLIDLAHPETVYAWPDPQAPYMPWGWNQAGEGPLGEWLIEFMQKLNQRRLNYTLSAWWFNGNSGQANRLPDIARIPSDHTAGADLWITLLHEWKRRFGFDGLIYVDLANEVPYFLPGFMARYQAETGSGWDETDAFTPGQIAFLAGEINPAIARLQYAFPELRFTASIHGDYRWVDVPLAMDCLDVHFYADVDPRWRERTGFAAYTQKLFTDASWHREFSERCKLAHRSVGPMLRAAQRDKLAAFSAWGEAKGMPLTTTEFWSSWYYYDSPDLDWGWLLDWAEWSVEDAIDYRMWGWTPHNYVQPQFKNWQDARWHRRLTDRFLRS